MTQSPGGGEYGDQWFPCWTGIQAVLNSNLLSYTVAGWHLGWPPLKTSGLFADAEAKRCSPQRVLAGWMRCSPWSTCTGHGTPRVHTGHLFGSLETQRGLGRGEVTCRITSQTLSCLVQFVLRNHFQWNVSGVSTKTDTHVQLCSHILPMDKSVSRHQCVFQLVAIKQPEGNVICTRTEFQNMPCSCPCPRKQHPPPTSLLLRSFPLHCSSSSNRGKQMLWPWGSKIIKVTFPKGKILLTFWYSCIHNRNCIY